MKKIFAILAAAAALCACGPKLVILHTNDTHSHLDPDREGRGGILERAAFVDSVRKAEGADKVLLLHAGDFNQGTSFDDGIESLTERAKLIKCPIVCANLDLSSFELGQYVKPWCIVNKGGKKIGIIGLEANISTCVSKVVSSRIPQLDAIAETNKWAKHLRENEKCDMVILLSHFGYVGEPAGTPDDQTNMAGMQGIDLVVSGHSHTFVDDFIYVNDLDGKPVPIITDGCWGLDMGMIKMY